MTASRPHPTTSLPPLPLELRQTQAVEWAKMDARLAASLRRFLQQIERKRAEHGTRAGWLPQQVGYLTVKAFVSNGAIRRFIHVLLADRDLDTGVPIEGRNERIYCFVEATSGAIYKVSTDGKALAVPRGNIHDEASAWRAITPFGIESR